jgi:carbonic anhydrase/acetyltransferase-like protein (isoleucine patch superfamily)
VSHPSLPTQNHPSVALIKPYQHHRPQIAESVFLAENATLIGEISIDEESSVWYSAVLRGDVGPIAIGQRSSIQDLVMVHCTLNRSRIIIGDDVVVGHGAILHGCTIESEVLVGMNATILDDAVVPTHCIVAANALVPERMQLEAGYLYAGVPAKKLKPITAEQVEIIRGSSRHYLEYARHHRATQM